MSLLDTLAGVETVRPQPMVVTPVAPVIKPATHGVTVVPYNACLDPQADSFLPWMWKKMQDDDLVDYYFPGQKDTGFATFVRLFSGDGEVAIFKTEGSDSDLWEDRVAGFITWTPQRLGASDVLIAGFIFFKKFWGHEVTDVAGEAAFTYWFNKTTASVILGVCPALHVLAMRYNKRVGLRETGRVPLAHLYKGQPCDAVLMAMTRDEWIMKGRE